MLTKSKNHNPNYLAKIVKLSKPVQHPNAERLLGWIIDGNRVWTDNTNYKEGDIVVYFPLECQINPLILSELNLYSKSDMNVDKTQKGFFDGNGRVRAIKLRGEPSEGFVLKYEHFDTVFAKESDKTVLINFIENIGKEFDTINDIWICKKYIPKTTQGRTVIQKQGKKVKDILIENQFQFHYDTEQLKKNIHKIQPEDLITISKKYHGTSGISANVLCKKQLHPLHRFLIHNMTIENCLFLPWLFMIIFLQIYSKPAAWTIWGLYIPHLLMVFFNKKYRTFMYQTLGNPDPVEYKDICSSRKVIKSIGEETKKEGGYYKFDIWKHVHNTLKGSDWANPTSLELGITLYYEIIGYLPNGQLIQKGYDYGCTKPEPTEWNLLTSINSETAYYKRNTHYKVLVYRITYTTPEGRVIEYSWQQIKQYCQKYGLKMPKTYYEGKVSDYTDSDFSDGSNHDVFLEQLQYEYLEKQDDECNHKVPDEGIVIRIENGKPEAYKLKSFAFLEGESKALDEGTIDIETEQSE